MLIKEWEFLSDLIYGRYMSYLYDLEIVYDIADHPSPYNYYSVMHFDFAHIVWEDGNFESHHIEWCIDEGINSSMDKRFKRLLLRSLKELLLLPKYEGCEDYE